MAITFTFNHKIPGTLTDGAFGQSMTRIEGPALFNGVQLYNLVGIGNTNNAGASPAYAAPCANQTAIGDWVEQIQLHPSDQAITDDCEVDDLSGNFLLVGSEAHNSGAGAAYVFEFSSSSTWTQMQELTGSDTAPGDAFVGLSIYGNTLICGAGAHNSNKGEAYIFNLVSGVWTQTQILAPADLLVNSQFGGASGVLLGNQLFISTFSVGAVPGKVYYYAFNGTRWVLEQEITLPVVGGALGTPLAFDGVSLVVGAPSASGGGSVFVYHQSVGGVFTLVATLTGSDTTSGDDFGYSVAVQGLVIAVGALNNGTNGAVYLFQSGVQSQKIVQTDATGSDKFGCKVALYSGPTSWLVVGAYANGGSAQGAAYFYSVQGSLSPVVIYAASLGFAGVRRNPGRDPSRKTYEYRPKAYTYPLQTTFTTVGIVAGQYAPIITLTQSIDNYDFDLCQLILTYVGPNGPVSLTVPYTALWVYDVNGKQISNFPVLDTFLNGAPGSKYRNGALVPPLFYPRNSRFRVDITNLISNPALLPLTLTLHLVGRQRIPC